MTREEKARAVEEIGERIAESPSVYLTDYSGLTVAESNQLRRQFRAAGVDFRVVKNTLIRLAMERLGGYDDVVPHLAGPTALAFSENPSAPAKVIKNFADKVDVKKPELKAAMIDGAYFGAGQLDMLAALKSREELIGDILGLLMSPASNLVGAIQSPGSTVAGIVKVLAERPAA
jgi:large subunit ribosomal protein L10